MEQDLSDSLKNFDWFNGLPDEVLAALVQKVRKRVLGRDEILFRKGDVGDSLFIILSGWVKIVTQDEQGDEVVLNQVGTGEIIGEMALLDYEPRSAGVVALENTSTLELSREDFMETLNGYPELALSIILNLISRLRHNTSYIEQITDMSRRVARGDYSFIGEAQPAQARGEKMSAQDKIEQLMVEFYSMVKGVREREEELKEQVQKLALQIDEAKRKQAFEEITGSDFYASLKKQAQKLRAQRKDNK
jgi:CRP/FNR family cyclic AMP-dependent transcriptional regulator